jgi:DNA-binding CsgD family transcriptional regulator
VVAGAPIGRQAELAVLERLAADVRTSGRAAVATVLGDAGIGKTTLLGAATGGILASGGTVLRTSLTAAETHLAWAGLHGLVGARHPDLTQGLSAPARTSLLAALGLAEADVDPLQVGVAVAGVVSMLAGDGLVAVVVDDLHWLDAATAGVVAFAVRATEHAPVLTILAARPDLTLPVEGHRLLAADRHTRVDLPGLSPAGVHQLLAQSCGVVLRRPDLIRVHSFTGGNPLHVVETGRLLASGRSLDDALLPASLQAAITARLDELPPDTRRCLEVVALSASPTVTLIQQALPEVEVETSLLVAEDAAVVEVSGDTVSFRHPLLRAGVLDGLAGLRRRHHLRALAAVVDDPDERALLLAEAASGPDEEVAAAVEEAGHRAASQGVPILAAERYRRAAVLSAGDEARARRLTEAAEAAFAGGDPAGALEPAEEAHRLTSDSNLKMRSGMCAVLTLAQIDELPHALVRAEQLLDAFAGDPARQAHVLRTIARIRAFDDVGAAIVAVDRALELAEQSGDSLLLTHTVAVAAAIRQWRGDPVDVGAVVRLLSSLPDLPLPARSLALELLTWTDHVEEAMALGWGLLAEAEAAGSIDDMGAIRDQLADACFRAGRWDDAVALVRATLDADRLAMTKGPADCRPADLAQTLAAKGHHDQAAELLAEAMARQDLPPVIRLQRATRAGFVALAAGDAARAADHLREARREALAMGDGDLGAMPFRADLVEALLALGALDEAAEVAAEHRALAERGQLLRGAAEAARTAGMVAAARGDLAHAIASFEEALAVHERWPVPFERGRTLLALGATLRRAGRRAQAAGWLDDAHAVFAALGAHPWLARVDAERDRLGARRSRGTGLTPTEQRIAELAAQGRTNAEIATELVVSRRTVESNLTRAYRKLGVRSRTELAARVRELG